MAPEKGSKPAPLLSIVIPTRNRQNYATSAVRSILGIPSDEIEVILQDSSDSPSLKEFASRLNDPRLSYNYSPPPISGVDNFNIAAELVTGEYACFIGDDDGVNPEILDATSWARANNLDALTPSVPAYYSWPDLESKYFGNKHAGNLYLWKFNGSLSFPVLETEMLKCAQSAGQEFYGLPKVYCGIVRTSTLRETQRQNGKIFGGTSPDIYSALAVANHVKRHCLIDYPLILPGGSRASTAGDSAKGSHKGRLEDVRHLAGKQIDEWPEIVPRFYSVETVRAESAFLALRDSGRMDLCRSFNLPLLYALCCISHPGYLPVILASLNKSLPPGMAGIAKQGAHIAIALGQAVKKNFARIGNRLLHPSPSKGGTSIGGLKDIMEAVHALQIHLTANGLRFKELIAKAGAIPRIIE